MAEEGKEDFAKRHVIYGSAGMAAAGMIPSAKKKSTAPQEEAEVEDSKEAEGAATGEEAPVEKEDPTPPVEAPYQGVKAAVIGHTGSGDFGRGLDRAFQRISGARLIALTDVNAETAEESQIKSGAKSVYNAYQRMISDESPNLVVVAPSATGERFPMAQEALNSEANLFCEVPFTRTLKEADELLALANEKRLCTPSNPGPQAALIFPCKSNFLSVTTNLTPTRGPGSVTHYMNLAWVVHSPACPSQRRRSRVTIQGIHYSPAWSLEALHLWQEQGRWRIRRRGCSLPWGSESNRCSKVATGCRPLRGMDVAGRCHRNHSYFPSV